MTSATGVAVGTQVTATASCPSGKKVLGGGANVTTTDSAHKAVLTSSYPSDVGSWTATAVTTAALANGKTVTVAPYVVCTP